MKFTSPVGRTTSFLLFFIILSINLRKDRLALSRIFYVRTNVKFTFANKIGRAMYERLRVYVKVESNPAQLLAKLNTYCYLASIFQLRE